MSGRASPAADQVRPKGHRARQAGRRPETVQCRRACPSPAFLPVRSRPFRQLCERQTHAAAHECTPLTCAGPVVSVNMLSHPCLSGEIRSSPMNAPAAFRTTCGSKSPTCCWSGWKSSRRTPWPSSLTAGSKASIPTIVAGSGINWRSFWRLPSATAESTRAEASSPTCTASWSTARSSVERLFTFAYLTERTTLDELALDDRIGATSEPWPLVAQLVRRGSFDLLGAYVERTQLEPSGAAITDKLTTLHTRPLFDAVLAKEVERAARFGASAFADSVRRRSSVRDQQGTRVRRGRQDPRAPRHSDAHLFPPARLGRAAFGRFDRRAAVPDGRRPCQRAGRARQEHRRGAARLRGPPDRPPRDGQRQRRDHQPDDRGRRRHRHRTADGGCRRRPSSARSGRDAIAWSGSTATPERTRRARSPNRTLPRSSPSAWPPPSGRRASSYRRAPCLPQCRAAAAA